MSFQGNVLYSPYGAAELKATYQRNMALGSLTAVSLVLLTIGTVWVTGAFQGYVIPEIEEEPDKGGIIRWDPPPTLDIPRPVVGTQPTRSVIPNVGIPEPRPDEEFPDDYDVIPTNQQRAIISDGPPGPPGVSGGPGDISVDGNAGSRIPCLPEIVEFCEIYPVLVHHELPEYPSLAEKVGIEGSVWVKALVDTDGSVKKVEVAKSSEIAALDEAAVKAAYKNKFTPGIQNGRPVLVWVTYKVEFVLDR